MGATLLLPLGVGLLLAFVFEQWLRPTPPRWPLPAAALAVHTGTWLLWQTAISALVGRPWLALVLALIAPMTLVVVSNAKYRALREPFTVHDFEYFVDMVRHPRLYLPFLRFTRQTALTSMLMFCVLVGAFMLESWVFGRFPPLEVGVGYGLVALLGLLLLVLGLHSPQVMTWDALVDLRAHGIVTCLWCYARALRDPGTPQSPLAHWQWPARGGTKPHLVMVQSESFFDCRRLDAAIRPEILREFDRTCLEARAYGRLRVPAWGANTIRTEFGMLFGLSAEAQGVHRFQPYQRLAWRGLPQLVSILRDAGYRTICVHPYELSFYNRARLFPALGFETLIDGSHFKPADRVGPYIGDAAVTRCVENLLAEAGDRPCFIFVITMENHGPLHLERPDAEALTTFYHGPPPPKHHDLSVYLGHLRHADEMLGRLRTVLLNGARPGCLVWYGDHVPIMPKVYAHRAHDDPRTDYLLWSSRLAPAGLAAERGIDELPSMILAMLVDADTSGVRPA